MPTDSRPVSTIAAVVLAIVALAHLLRAVLAVEVVVGDQSVPLSVSVVATVVAAGLAIGVWREAHR